MSVPSRRSLVGLLAVASLLAPSPAHGQADPLQGFDSYVETAAADWGAVGLAVAVVKDGELLYSRGYGVRNLEEGGPVNGETLFAIGSTTKAMTAAALGMLVDEGRLGWDDPVVQHLPGFRLSDPWLTREITVRDLLTHRAGLGNADFLWYEVETDLDEVLDRFSHAPLSYSPRTSFIYQNIMYAAAGAVVESVSGLPWGDFMRTRIFEPLGMARTVPLLAETESMTNVAAPHDRVGESVVPIRNASVDPVRAAGSIWSSVEDMSRWLRMLLAGGVAPDGTRLLSEGTLQELFRPQSFVTEQAFYPTARLTRPSWTTYGLGWFQHDYRGHKVDFHTGSIDGMVAIAGLIRDQGIGIYVLGNRDHVEVRHALMYRVFDLFLAPADARDWSAELKELYDDLAARGDEAVAAAEAQRVEGTSPSHPLEDYVGRYGSDRYGELEVAFRDGGLFVERGPGLQGTLEHWHFDTFRAMWQAGWRTPGMVTFRTDSGGKITGLEMGGIPLERLEPDAGT